MIKISPSAIGMLLDCPRCLYLFYKECLRRPDAIFPSLPGGMDAVIKKYFDTYSAKNQLPPEISKEVKAKLFTQMDKLSVWRDNWTGIQAEFPEYDILLKGAIDELLVDSKGKYIILDYKTLVWAVKEDTHRHYLNQLNLYALLFEKNKMPVAEFGYLLFFWPESYQTNKAIFNTQLVKIELSAEKGREVLKKVHQILSGPKPAAHSECSFCRYRQSFANEMESSTE